MGGGPPTLSASHASNEGAEFTFNELVEDEAPFANLELQENRLKVVIVGSGFGE